MKTPLRILLSLLCAAIVLSMPFFLSSPNMLGEVKASMMEDSDEEEDEEGEEIDFLLPPRRI